MMQLRRLLGGIGLLVAVATLAGCGYEVGFEYTTDAALAPVHKSGVRGTVTIGYGMQDPAFRMRLALHGLRRGVSYQVRFFDAASCNENELANAHRIDALRDAPNRTPRAWGFAAEPLSLSGNFFGSAEQEFKLSMPRAPSMYSSQPDQYPTVLIYESTVGKARTEDVLEPVACGTISMIATNHRPHM